VNDLNDRIAGLGVYKEQHTAAMGNLIEIRDKLVAAIDAKTGGAYSKYRADYAERMSVLDPFQKGTLDRARTKAEYDRMYQQGPMEAGEALFPKGAAGDTVGTRVMSVLGKDKEFMDGVKSHVGDLLRQLRGEKGGLTEERLAAFRRDYGPALKAYGLDKTVGSLEGATVAAAERQAEMDAVRAANTTQRQRYENDIVGKLTGVDPAHAVGTIMSDAATALPKLTKAVQSVGAADKTGAGMNGLRRQFNQYLFDNPKQAGELARVAEKSGLYNKDQAAAIRQIAEDLNDISARAKASKITKFAGEDSNSAKAAADYTIRKVGFILLSGVLSGAATTPVGGVATAGAAYGASKVIERQRQKTFDAVANIIKDPAKAKELAKLTKNASKFTLDTIARQIAAQVAGKNPGAEPQDDQ